MAAVAAAPCALPPNYDADQLIDSAQKALVPCGPARQLPHRAYLLLRLMPFTTRKAMSGSAVRHTRHGLFSRLRNGQAETQGRGTFCCRQLAEGDGLTAGQTT